MVSTANKDTFFSSSIRIVWHLVFIFYFGVLYFECIVPTLKTKLNVGFLPLDLWGMCLLPLSYICYSLRVSGSMFIKMRVFPSFTNLIPRTVFNIDFCIYQDKKSISKDFSLLPVVFARTSSRYYISLSVFNLDQRSIVLYLQYSFIHSTRKTLTYVPIYV